MGPKGDAPSGRFSLDATSADFSQFKNRAKADQGFMSFTESLTLISAPKGQETGMIYLKIFSTPS